MENLKTYDTLGWEEDKDIKKIIQEEKIIYSDYIIKTTNSFINRDRIILLTDKHLYNMKKKELSRKTKYEEIIGITYSKTSNEMAIHVKNDENDYGYSSPDRGLIISLIIKLYQNNTGKKLKLCAVDAGNLKNYITSKKEKKKDEGFSRMDENFLIDPKEFLSKYYTTQNDGNNNNSEGGKRKRTGTIFSKHHSIKTVTLDDFQIIKVIGRGSYGKVCLVQYKKTGEYFAMKSLKKDVLLDEDQVESTLLEKKILQSLNYPFLVGMLWCFQTEERIYFVMPFVQGGELFQHLRNAKYFPEEKVKFYAAIIGLSLEYLHTHGIVYRDIKPENILMESDGYLKLIDFGMAKILEGDEKANSFCGTPEYLAPEIITGEGHNMNADWWSYGTLIYEMLFGIPPFFCENVEKMYELITHANVRFPKKITVSEEVKDLLLKLLVKDQDQRLGSKGGFDTIKSHPWFKGFDFNALEQKKLEAPFKPELSGKLDVTNFDSEFTSEDVVSSAIENKQMELIKKNQDQFEGFNE